LAVSALSRSDNFRIVVVTEVKPEKVPDTSRIRVHLSSDGLLAFVTVVPGLAAGRAEFDAAIAHGE